MPNQEARMAAQRRPLTLTLTLTLTEETNAQARCLLVATTALHVVRLRGVPRRRAWLRVGYSNQPTVTALARVYTAIKSCGALPRACTRCMILEVYMGVLGVQISSRDRLQLVGMQVRTSLVRACTETYLTLICTDCNRIG